MMSDGESSDDEGGEGGEGGAGVGKGFASASHLSANLGSIGGSVGSTDAPPFYASHRAAARSADL